MILIIYLNNILRMVSYSFSHRSGVPKSKRTEEDLGPYKLTAKDKGQINDKSLIHFNEQTCPPVHLQVRHASSYSQVTGNSKTLQSQIDRDKEETEEEHNKYNIILYTSHIVFKYPLYLLNI